MHAEAKLLDLVGAMEDLKAMRNSVLKKIELEEGKGKQPTQRVQAWLDKVVDIEQRTNELMIDFNRCCVTGCCSLNIYSRLNGSKKATKLKKEIDELMKEKVSVLAKKRSSDPIIDMPTSLKNVGKMIVSNLRVVRDCLANKTCGIIGIYGMGGIGKTTLLKEIKRSIDDCNMGFDYVIHARASYELHVEDLRDCIAEQLPLCEPSRETIFKFLKYKNFLLLLDDLWEELDITVLGIPDPHDESDVTTLYKHKVVFTTRSQQVCDCMRADEKIKLDCLDKYEGWQLFKETLAMNLGDIASIEEAAREMASLCGGLPLALIMLGQAMSNKTSIEGWTYVLNQQQDIYRLFSSSCESLFSYLRSSYDSLANETLQQCFLCLCLWPRNKLISIEDLIKCWLGFGLIYYFDSLSEAYVHGCHIIKILEEASLITTHDNKAVIEVQEVTHDMAQWIVSGAGGRHKSWIVGQNIMLEPLPAVEVMSIVNGNMNSLPELQYQYPNLLRLNIQHNQRLENLPKVFFQQMPNLTYLNLSSTGIHKLPTEITQLSNLVFLDISCTRIKSLPYDMKNLKKLKYLFCRYVFLGKVQAGLLSNLCSLEVLDLYPYGYVELAELHKLRGLKGLGMFVFSDEIFQKLSGMPIINIHIQDIKGLLTLHLNSLTIEGYGWPKEFQIKSFTAVQDMVISDGIKTSLKFLRIFDLPKLESFVWRIQPREVLPMLQLVQIEECHSLTSLHWVLHLPFLRALKLKNCDSMEELVNEEVGGIQEDHAISTFPKLKYLTILGLPSLVKISRCALDFPHLSKVHLEDCPNLKRLPFKSEIVNNQGLLIKCERKWWERLEWDDAIARSQFCSNSAVDEEIAEFFVGNVPTRDEEIVEFFVGNVPTQDEGTAENFVGSVPRVGHEDSPTKHDPPTKSGLRKIIIDINHHPSHPGYKLKQEKMERRYICDGCKEFGFGTCYTCTNTACNFCLHEYCAYPEEIIFHPFFPSLQFRFKKEALNRYCDACGKDINGYLYQNIEKGYDLHPCCAKLPHVLNTVVTDEGDEVKLVLKKKVRFNCYICRKKKMAKNTWSYESENKTVHAHVSCLKDFLYNNWSHGLQIESKDFKESSGTSRFSRMVTPMALAVLKARTGYDTGMLNVVSLQENMVFVAVLVAFRDGLDRRKNVSCGSSHRIYQKCI